MSFSPNSALFRWEADEDEDGDGTREEEEEETPCKKAMIDEASLLNYPSFFLQEERRVIVRVRRETFASHSCK